MRAAEHLAESNRLAQLTDDLPILAVTGLGTALFAEALGEQRQTAVLLGASARLRGAADKTQTSVAELTAQLREALGEEFDLLHADGLRLSREQARVAFDPAALKAALSGRGRPNAGPPEQVSERWAADRSTSCPLSDDLGGHPTHP